MGNKPRLGRLLAPLRYGAMHQLAMARFVSDYVSQRGAPPQHLVILPVRSSGRSFSRAITDAAKSPANQEKEKGPVGDTDRPKSREETPKEGTTDEGGSSMSQCTK